MEWFKVGRSIILWSKTRHDARRKDVRLLFGPSTLARHLRVLGRPIDEQYMCLLRDGHLPELRRLRGDRLRRRQRLHPREERRMTTEQKLTVEVRVLGRPAAWDSEWRAGDLVETTNDPNHAHEWLLALARRGYNAEARVVPLRGVGAKRPVNERRRVSEYPVCTDESCIHERTTSFDHLSCEDARREARKGEPQGVFVPRESNTDYCDGCKQHAIAHDDEAGACPS